MLFCYKIKPKIPLYSVVKVDRRIRWHYTTTILLLRIGARLTRCRNCKFHNFARTISRHADGISRYSVQPSAGPLLSPVVLEHKIPHFQSPPPHRIASLWRPFAMEDYNRFLHRSFPLFAFSAFDSTPFSTRAFLVGSRPLNRIFF